MQEYSIKKIVSEAYRLYLENLEGIAILTLIIMLPVNIITEYLLTDMTKMSQIIIFMLLTTTAGLLWFAAITLLIKSGIDKKKTTIKESLKKALKKWWLLIQTTIIASIFILGLTLLLIVPGIIYTVYWLFSNYIVVLKDKTRLQALGYSKKIVEGRWWEIFLYLIVFGIITAVIISVVTFVSAFTIMPVLSIAWQVVSQIAEAFVTVILIVFFTNIDATALKKLKND